MKNIQCAIMRNRVPPMDSMESHRGFLHNIFFIFRNLS